MDAYDALMRDGYVVVRQAIAPALVRTSMSASRASSSATQKR